MLAFLYPSTDITLICLKPCITVTKRNSSAASSYALNILSEVS